MPTTLAISLALATLAACAGAAVALSFAGMAPILTALVYAVIAIVWMHFAAARGRPLPAVCAAPFGVVALVAFALAATGRPTPTKESAIVAALVVGAALLGARIGRMTFDRADAQPWRCVRCHYDKRGLPPDAPCPECGAK